MAAIVEQKHALTERQRTLAILIADGMSIEDAATRLKVQRRYVREALRDPLVKAELAAARDAMRSALQPRAVNKLGELMDSDTESIALQASKAILGDDAKGPIVNVGVQVNNAVSVRPGYAYRLPQPEPKMIEGKGE